MLKETKETYCTAEPRIPFYLVVAGILTIILLVVRLVFQKCCQKCGEPGDGSKFCNSLNFLASFSCITIYDILALVTTVIWLIVGTVWTFNIYDTVDFDNTNSSNYCPKVLYRFTYGTVITGWIFVVLAPILGFLAKSCKCFVLCEIYYENYHIKLFWIKIELLLENALNNY